MTMKLKIQALLCAEPAESVLKILSRNHSLQSMYGLLSAAEEAAEPEASPPQRFLRRYESREPRILENGSLLMSFLFHFHFKVVSGAFLFTVQQFKVAD